MSEIAVVDNAGGDMLPIYLKLDNDEMDQRSWVEFSMQQLANKMLHDVMS